MLEQIIKEQIGEVSEETMQNIQSSINEAMRRMRIYGTKSSIVTDDDYTIILESNNAKTGFIQVMYTPKMTEIVEIAL